MADPLKKITHIIYGVSIDPRQFEREKDQPLEIFDGLTPRQAYIDTSEKRMKPAYGKHIFGEIFCRTAENSNAEFIICADGGFEAEVEKMCEHFGKESLLLFHVKRPGTDFSNDSRSYIFPELALATIDNDGSIEDLYGKVEEIFDKFILPK